MTYESIRKTSTKNTFLLSLTRFCHRRKILSSCNHKVCTTQRFIRLASEAVTDKSEQITIIKNFETHRNILLKSICIS